MDENKDFFQKGPELKNQYDDDAVLRAWLAAHLPADVLSDIEPGLRTLGERAATDMLAMAANAEANPPRHVPYDPWGRRIDRIETGWGWRALHRVAAEEGIVTAAYERAHGPWSRLHQVALLYLYHPSSALYSCPLSMTDGAARVLDLFADDDLKSRALPRLISRDPDSFWTSGQWMTERAGGSDVSHTATVAKPDGAGFRLYGTKWFTSAVTADVAVTLARDESAKGAPLSLFYLETRAADGGLNHIFIHRLKDKLGTRALPTAELTLKGTPARRIGEPGKGVRTISTVLNITRLYNAVAAVGYMRRGIALAGDYAEKRRAFGKYLIEQPLHSNTIKDLQAEFQAGFHLVFHLAMLLGRAETGQASDAEHALLRLLTPIVKLYTGKQAVAVVSEVLECFGGMGYIEDTGLPVLLRDCQVLPIWEGTTNVLSLDVLRALGKAGTLETWLEDARRHAESLQHSELGPVRRQILAALEAIRDYAAAAGNADRAAVEAGARSFAFSLARTYAEALIAETAQHELTGGVACGALDALRRWCSQSLAPLPQNGIQSM
jgi:alkylation response protein AidB-like acyl-CoA dehydrogenase